MGGQTGDSGRQPRCRATRRQLRSQRDGKSSQNYDSSPEKAYAVADGQVEGGAEGEAQGAVNAWDRTGAGHTQRHGEKVHERRESTYVTRALGVNGTLVW